MNHFKVDDTHIEIYAGDCSKAFFRMLCISDDMVRDSNGRLTQEVNTEHNYASVKPAEFGDQLDESIMGFFDRAVKQHEELRGW